jgi:dTDP-4-amino-4,6-dideoxygalactose transaminase
MAKGLPMATSTWDEREIAALNRVIESGQFSMGDEVKAFETEFASFVGAKHCVMVNSGSSANLLAVAALFYRKDNPLKRGDEVIVPAVSWSTTYFPLYQHGLRLKFVDIDSETLNLDLDRVRDAIGPNTRMIFGVNLLGNPIDFFELEEIIGDRDIIVLEDNCESLGAMLQGQHAGTFGLAGTYSSFFSHHISTMEGGLVVTDDEEFYEIMLVLRAHGWTRNLPTKNHICAKSDDAFEESFRFVLPGYNLRPLEMSGALGREQIQKLPDIVAGRRANAEAFRETFSDHPELDCQRETGSSSWFGFAFTLKNRNVPRRELLKHLQSKNIDTRPVVAGNFTRNDVIKFFDYSIHADLKNADRIHDFGFFIGNHHYDISDEIVRLREIMDSFL